MDNKYVLVIGAANIDLGGTPYKPLIPNDSNPGVIKMNYGGVARNIAHNLAMLGAEVELVTAAGDDILGLEMLKKCEMTGIDTSLSVIVPGGSSSVYLFINDEKGEMELALSHVDIVNHITPEYISPAAATRTWTSSWKTTATARSFWRRWGSGGGKF